MSEPLMVIGRYALYDPIASGGIGTVHLGRVLGSVGFTRTVAIKRLRAQYASDPSFLSSFIDEARLAARVRHPNVVPTLDVVATKGELFLVMEYVHGETASQLWRTLATRGERIPVRVAASIMVGVLLGLHAAHDARNEKGEPLRIVHRDISPQNIIIGSDGHARVLDFGIAMAARRLQSTQQDEGVKGKMAYLAPEQGLKKPVDHRTDVYAASVVLWELLTGQRLFAAAGGDAQATARAVIAGHHAPPSTFARDVTREVDAIVLRGLAVNANDRWPTARAMAIALEDCAAPATTSQVSSWIGRAAESALGARGAAVAEMESEITTTKALNLALGEIDATREDEEPPLASDEPTRRAPE